MYAFLLVLGSIISAAGVALIASGVSIQQHTFDASNVTPGTVAITGGCILIGLAFVVRALLRVERALMVRPMPRPARVGEAVSSAMAAAQPGEPGRIPFPSKPKAAPHPQPAPVPASARPTAAEEATPERLRAPVLERVESAPMVVEESEVSLLPKAPARSDEEKGEINHGVAGRANGAAPVRTAPAVAGNGRAARRPQQQPKSTIFDSLWPKTQRAAPEVQAAPAAPAAAPAPATQPARASEPSRPAQPAAAQQAPVSVLKSGVVEGMAYTLYSDGSIEAQLPGGTLRFGSITELRNHIEQNG